MRHPPPQLMLADRVGMSRARGGALDASSLRMDFTLSAQVCAVVLPLVQR